MENAFFEVRGVVEGFYGVFYTFPQRDDLIRFMGRHGFNFYLYGPKNDRQHRARWREPYPDKVMRQFANTVALARENGITFSYALTPGLSMCYSAQEDFEAVTRKLRAFYDIGVRAFCLFCDDMSAEFKYAADTACFRSYGEAHVYLCNRVYEWLQSLDPACSLSMCPTDYWGGAPFSLYLHELGAGLYPAIDIYYTGVEICSGEITRNDADLAAEVLRRKPIIWDNYPANDLSMKPELHIGPITGRDPNLYQSVRGLLSNPMNQPEASKIPLYTFAAYMHDPHAYNPQTAWAQALEEIAGEHAGALRLFAETSMYYGQDTPEAIVMQGFVLAVLESVQRGDRLNDNPYFTAMLNYLNDLDEACYQLKFRMENLALRNELLPWIELVELWLWIGRRSLLILQAIERGDNYEFHVRMLDEELTDVKAHHKRIGGQVLTPLVDVAMARIPQSVLEKAIS